MKAAILTSLLLSIVLSQASLENMNGEYIISNPNPTKGGKYSTNHRDRASTYFEVYTPPIRTRYGEVFWTMMDAVPLPKDIVDKFADSSMAVVGYEVD